MLYLLSPLKECFAGVRNEGGAANKNVFADEGDAVGDGDRGE